MPGGSQYAESQSRSGFLDSGLRRNDGFWGCLSPPSESAVTLASHLVQLKGASRGEREAGRGAASRGSGFASLTLGRRRGSARVHYEAPPGAGWRPLGPYQTPRSTSPCGGSNREAGHLRPESAARASGEIAAMGRAERRARAARHACTIVTDRVFRRAGPPSVCPEGKRADPGCGRRIAATTWRVCKPLAGGVGCARLTRDPERGAKDDQGRIQIVRHEDGWAYKARGTFSEIFPRMRPHSAAARNAAGVSKESRARRTHSRRDRRRQMARGGRSRHGPSANRSRGRLGIDAENRTEPLADCPGMVTGPS